MPFYITGGIVVTMTHKGLLRDLIKPKEGHESAFLNAIALMMEQYNKPAPAGRILISDSESESDVPEDNLQSSTENESRKQLALTGSTLCSMCEGLAQVFQNCCFVIHLIFYRQNIMKDFLTAVFVLTSMHHKAQL